MKMFLEFPNASMKNFDVDKDTKYDFLKMIFKDYKLIGLTYNQDDKVNKFFLVHDANGIHENLCKVLGFEISLSVENENFVIHICNSEMQLFSIVKKYYDKYFTVYHADEDKALYKVSSYPNIQHLIELVINENYLDFIIE